MAIESLEKPTLMAMTGLYVKEKIEGLGIPLAEVARTLKIQPQTLQKRLNVDDMKIGVLQEIATAIGKNVYFFLDGGTMTVQQQNVTRGSNQNTQQGAFNGSSLTVSQTSATLERQLSDCQDRLQEKDQVITDLRRTITLYEKLLSNTSARL